MSYRIDGVEVAAGHVKGVLHLIGAVVLHG